MNRMNRAATAVAVMMMSLTAQMQGSQASHILGATAGLVSGLWLRQKGVGDCVLAKQVTLPEDPFVRVAVHAVLRDHGLADRVATEAVRNGAFNEKEVKAAGAAAGQAEKKKSKARRNSDATEKALLTLKKADEKGKAEAGSVGQQYESRLQVAQAALLAQDFAGLPNDEKARRIAGFLSAEESRKIEKEQDMLDNAIRVHAVKHKLVREPKVLTSQDHFNAVKRLTKQQLVAAGFSDEAAEAILAS